MLPAETILAAAAIADDVERGFAHAHRITGSNEWPDGCCVEASYSLVDELREKVPDAGAEYVWGDITIGPLAIGHVWVALADGTIVDLTLGQFTRGPALAVIPPGDPLARRYRAKEIGRPGLEGRRRAHNLDPAGVTDERRAA